MGLWGWGDGGRLSPLFIVVGSLSMVLPLWPGERKEMKNPRPNRPLITEILLA